MRFESVPTETVNKLFRNTKLQSKLNEFMESPDIAVHCILEEGEYASMRSAQSAYCAAIKHLRYSVKARILDGELYLIKVEHSPIDLKLPTKKRPDIPRNCGNCEHMRECSNMDSPDQAACSEYKTIIGKCGFCKNDGCDQLCGRCHEAEFWENCRSCCN